MGTVADHTARATFAKNWFEAIGVESLGFKGSTDPAEIAAACLASGADFAVVCGTNEQYADMGPSVVEALKGVKAKGVWLAGKGGDADAMAAAGLTGNIAVGGNLMECAATVWSLMGEAS